MKKALGIIVNILTWIVLIFALLITIIVFSSARNNGVANLMGYIPLTVESDSMYPTFAAGDLIITREVDDMATLQENDVITFWTIIDGKRVKNTHRIVEVNQAENSRSFITRGDNNDLDDEMPAFESDVIGKWTNVKITGFGNVMAFLRTKTGFFVCILIPMALFFLFELYKFIVTLIEVKRGDAPEQLDEEEIKRRAIEEYLAQQKAAAEGAETPAENPAEAPAEKPADAPAEKPADAPAEKPAHAPAEKPAEVPAEKPAEAPAEKPADTPAEKPAENAEPVGEAAVEKVETAEPEKVEISENAGNTSAEDVEKSVETVETEPDPQEKSEQDPAES